MMETDPVYLDKAKESLETAQAELLNRRFNSSANRSYYACFQAAVHALTTEGLRPRRPDGHWTHEAVHGQFNGELVNRQHRYPSSLRGTLAQNFLLRQAADYGAERVTEVRAARAVSRAQEFVEAVEQEGGA